ncbi:hypothetical protein AVDCRST_MAG92-4965 [uncultured Coleofasciculus sp.]|uniref:HTH cro/C1-type domain-containing protein n=1 Tax=uncultured Coleofasciculus sp. TaxID=1267456 RepID=A0A6J4K9W8_9CYAN|nr:hypothetical protein AVDCRST_MAG92-4965 [uncultured Coleofasciculus sp.]
MRLILSLISVRRLRIDMTRRREAIRLPIAVSPSVFCPLMRRNVSSLAKTVDDQKQNFNLNVPTLKQVRERLGMTQEEFGQALGITRESISRYERGVHQRIKFTIAQMKRLQELLEKAGLSIKDLPDDVE